MSFSPLSSLYQMVSDTQSDVSTVQTVESPAAYLTLRRTTTLSLVTSGTNIVWTSALREQAITWSGNSITIPSAGYYLISVNIALSTDTNAHIRYSIGGERALAFYTNPITTTGGFVSSCSAMLYMQESQTLLISIIPEANCTLNANAEGAAGPSPLLHIVQLSGVV